MIIFVIHRCLVAKHRLQTLCVVIHRHIFPVIGRRFLPDPVQPVTGPLMFQASEEPPHRGIVTTVALTAHTTIHPMLFSKCLASMTGIPGYHGQMMQQAGRRFSEIDCHLQGSDYQHFLYTLIH